MGERLYRTQILLEPEQHQSLSRIARRQSRSVSEIVREIIREYLAEEEEALRGQADAFKEIEAHRAEIIARNGGKPLDVDITAILEKIRQERADEIYAVIVRGR
jgi:predicted DNA-binding protein